MTKHSVRRIPQVPAMGEITTMLRRRRVKRGWTQRELATKVGCSQAAINYWELGVSVPVLPWAMLWCEALDYELFPEDRS